MTISTYKGIIKENNDHMTMVIEQFWFWFPLAADMTSFSEG